MIDDAERPRVDVTLHRLKQAACVIFTFRQGWQTADYRAAIDEVWPFVAGLADDLPLITVQHIQASGRLHDRHLMENIRHALAHPMARRTTFNYLVGLDDRFLHTYLIQSLEAAARLAGITIRYTCTETLNEALLQIYRQYGGVSCRF